VNDLNLQIIDVNWLNDVYTYCRDDGLHTSRIDHCICSNAVDQLLLILKNSSSMLVLS